MAPLPIPSLCLWNCQVNYFCLGILSSSGPGEHWFSMNWPFSMLVFGKMISVSWFLVKWPDFPLDVSLDVLALNLMSFPLHCVILWDWESHATVLCFPSSLQGPIQSYRVSYSVSVQWKKACEQQRYGEGLKRRQTPAAIHTRTQQVSISSWSSNGGQEGKE